MTRATERARIIMLIYITSSDCWVLVLAQGVHVMDGEKQAPVDVFQAGRCRVKLDG